MPGDTSSSPQSAPAGSPPPVSLAFLLITLGGRTRTSVEERLAERGLSFRYLSALGHLSRNPGLSYSELARRARVSVQSMQSTVAHLHDERLVERGDGAGQGKRAELWLTRRGRDLLAFGENALRELDGDLLAGVSRAERTALEAALLKIFLATSVDRG